MIKNLLKVFVKPISSTNELAKNSNFKLPLFLGIILSAVFAICNTITKLLNMIFVKKYSYLSGKYKMSVDFDNINFFKLPISFFGTLIVSAIVIVGIAGILFLLSKILKSKNVKFMDLFTISSTAMLPVAVVKILSIPFNVFYAPIATFLLTAASAYYILILILCFKNKLENVSDDKIVMSYMIISTVLTIVFYYANVFYNFIMELIF